MNKILSTIAVACGLAFGLATSVQAASHAGAAPASNPQQGKMAACNKEAGDKKGDERKAFMKTCLSAKKEPPTQQDKMKSCNASAKDKKGDERKAYMKECLSKKG